MSHSDAPPDRLRIDCPDCRTPLYPRPEHAGKRVRCPYCRGIVAIPAPEYAVTPSASAKPDQPAATNSPASAKTPAGSDSKAPRSTPPDVTADELYVLVICPTCQARLHPRREKIGRKIECPDCGVHVLVEPPRPAEPKAAPWVEDPGELEVGKEVERLSVPTEFLAYRAPTPLSPIEIRVPRAWYREGVLTYPWRKEILPGWVALSVVSFLAMFISFLMMIVARLAGISQIVVLGAPLCAMIWLFGAGCGGFWCFPVIEETANGIDEVQFPDFFTTDFAIASALMTWLLWCAAIPGGIAWFFLREHVPLEWIVLGGSVLGIMALPLLILASIESPIPFLPFAKRVTKSLKTAFFPWLITWSISLSLLAGWLAMTKGLSAISWFLVSFVGGPAFAALAFIHARLYGRLAWKICQLESRRASRGRKKASGELVSGAES